MEENNLLLCDPETGMCEVPQASEEGKQQIAISADEKIKVLYFTDPICSSCWGIEPQLRKLKLEYGEVLEIEYHMGGLLKDWTYNSGGISKPSDVAHHWDEVSLYYDMPIDGDVWLEDPLHSSYPPSIAFKAVQMQDEAKALVFLRALRELVFLKKKNITKWEYVAQAAAKVQLDVAKLKKDYENGAKDLFEQDLQLARQYAVRGFPTLFFIDRSGDREVVYGSKPYAAYEKAIQKLNENVSKKSYSQSWEGLFAKYPTLTANEFAQLSDKAREESEEQLNALVASGALRRLDTKNGSIWERLNE